MRGGCAYPARGIHPTLRCASLSSLLRRESRLLSLREKFKKPKITVMNNAATDIPQTSQRSRTNQSRLPGEDDELTRVKRELLKAEVRLAKARATIVTAEIDVRVLSAQLKALAR